MAFVLNLYPTETTPSKQQQQQVNKCHDCNKTFPTSHKLNLHTRIHLTSLAYPCPLCTHRFPTTTRLRLHKEGKHMFGEFKCHKCDKPFKSKLAMNRHYSVHRGLCLCYLISVIPCELYFIIRHIFVPQ